jgi:peptidoglycan/LPS O-acetylase OafA/YrhL
LQGLRALAVVLVVLYHVWLGRVPGGVDVFFLISGFLLTGQLLRATGRGRIGLAPLWGRVVKRLFPAALTVLLALVAACVVALPENRWFQTVREVVAAALYLENWQLVADAADYFEQYDEAGVVQHYWSLSIQGQFYLAWPLLVVAAVWAAHRVGVGVRRPVAALGWLGLVGLVACGLVLQVGSVFPGWAALWPTLCTATVITAGATGSRLGADRLLSARPVRYVGDLSYALYLWHWPVLVFYLVVRGRREVGWLSGAFVIGTSVALAVATHHPVEVPVRHSGVGEVRAWRAHVLGAAAMVPVLVAAFAWQAVPDLPPNVSFADFSDYICEDETYPPIIGNVFVYQDDNHLSATCTATMVPFVEADLLPLLGLEEGRGEHHPFGTEPRRVKRHRVRRLPRLAAPCSPPGPIRGREPESPRHHPADRSGRVHHRPRGTGPHRRATLFVTVLIAVDVLPGRCSGQRDILVGPPVAGRTAPVTEQLIGCFVDARVRRTDLGGGPDTADLVVAIVSCAMWLRRLVIAAGRSRTDLWFAPGRLPTSGHEETSLTVDRAYSISPGSGGTGTRTASASGPGRPPPRWPNRAAPIRTGPSARRSAGTRRAGPRPAWKAESRAKGFR